SAISATSMPPGNCNGKQAVQKMHSLPLHEATESPVNPSLESVLQHPGIWRGNQRAQTAADALPTGFAVLDELLPGGGWPRGALTEVLLSRQGIGELRLLTPALARQSQADGWLAWVAPPYVPYAAALAAAGIDLARLLVAKP